MLHGAGIFAYMSYGEFLRGQLLVNISSTMVRIWLQTVVNEQVYCFFWYFVLYPWIYLPDVILIFLVIRSTQTCWSLPTEITNIFL